MLCMIHNCHDYSGKDNLKNNLIEKLSFEISANSYAACYYDSNWWVGLVQNVNCDEKDVKTNFLHPPGSSHSFTWPNRRRLLGTMYECDK